jgi:hypothetical protein
MRNAGRGTASTSGLHRVRGRYRPLLANELLYGQFRAGTAAWFRHPGQESAKFPLERSALLSAHRLRKLVAGPGGMQEHCR